MTVRKILSKVGIVIVLVWLSLTACLAQTNITTIPKKLIEMYNQADNYRVHGKFEKAVELLQKVISKEKNFEEAYFRLGITYKGHGDIAQAIESFEKGLAMIKDPRRQNAYRYELGDLYLRIGNYSKSAKMLTLFLGTERDHLVRIEQAKVWQKNNEYALSHLSEMLPYHPVALSDTINRFPTQYYPVLTADNKHLIFVKRPGLNDDVDDEDIMISDRDESGKWTIPVSISPNINTDREEGNCTLSADGRYMIFTGCKVKNTNGSCDLFETKRTGDTWSRPVNLGSLVNSAAWDGQPSLSSDGQELYFISERKGGLGGRDIWYSKRDSVGEWTKAFNLGSAINTKYDELSPFIHVNNRNLYFSSNGYPGFGGFDLFVSEKINQQWTTPRNLGSPLNNYEDQFSFFVTADGQWAYYSKNEVSNINKSKLYVTPMPAEVQVKYYSNVVKGKVTDKQTGQPIQATVELYDIQKNERLTMVRSDSVTGEYLIVLTQGAEYALYTTSPGYLFKSLSFNYTAANPERPVEMDIQLDVIRKNAIAVLNNIFFETDKFDLKEKSITELQEVARFLKENPKLHVEIGGHTDNVGAVAYNLQLSLKRAQSVAHYLISEGVETTRIIQKGYGSQQPVKPNDSEEHRSVNRRIEFKILE